MMLGASSYADNDEDFTIYVEEDSSEGENDIIKTEPQIEEVYIKTEINDVGGGEADSSTPPQDPEALIRKTKEDLENGTLKTIPMCPICSYKPGHKRLILMHLEAHLENRRQYKCRGCDFVSFFKHVVTVHQTRCASLDQKIIACPQCSYVTLRHRHLKKHTQAMHLNKKVFRCSQCPFRTKTKGVMERHNEKEHKKVKNKYKCEECEFDTTRKDVLESHLRKHRPTVRKKTIYKCDVCDYESRYSSNVIRHRARHVM